MTIAWEEVFPMLAEAVPGFRPSKEGWEDRLSYPYISDMVRFVNDQTFLGDAEAKQLSRLLETLLADGDSMVHDLAVDAVETVSECENGILIAAHFGPETRRIWESKPSRT
jgi:hypothetical protein